MTATIETEKSWEFARAIAYDRYLPMVVLARAQNMLQLGHHGPIEVVYFPDAIGILNQSLKVKLDGTAEATMCLVTRDIHRTQDFLARNDPFDRTVRRWLDYLHAESVPCDGLKLPRVEHLARSATAAPLDFTPDRH